MYTSYSHNPCRYITGQEEIFALEKHYQGFYGSENRGTSSGLQIGALQSPFIYAIGFFYLTRGKAKGSPAAASRADPLRNLMGLSRLGTAGLPLPFKALVVKSHRHKLGLPCSAALCNPDEA